MDYFRARRFELAAELIMLRLRGREIRRAAESQLAPAAGYGRNVPSGRPWSTCQHALEHPHHRVPTECRASARVSV